MTGTPYSSPVSPIVEQLCKAGIKKIKVAVTDIDGILRGKYLSIEKLESATKDGFGFCSVVLGWDNADKCYDNVQFTGWHTGYPDTRVVLDSETLRYIPWEDKIPFLLGEFTQADGKPLEICPRQVLKRTIKSAFDLGFKTKVGCEYEWFNFKETFDSLEEKKFTNLKSLTPGMFGYSILRTTANSVLFNQLLDFMEQFRVPIEGLHTETGPGVFEAAIACTDALEAADRAVLFKSGTKEIFLKHGVVASFMARWNTSLPGCSGHIHQSLEDAQGKNLFFDPQDKLGMSEVYKSYLAGQIQCFPYLLPMLAPTVNSYKRLVEGYWAPTKPTWGVDNRTCAFRVIPAGVKATRLETRVPGADMNPYLSIAASLAAGLYGVKNRLKLEQAMVVGNGYADTKAESFPKNLYESATKFKNSEIANTLFGEAFVSHFANSRLWEWRQAQASVTDWELKRYFEII